jgi:hypothetical protein
MSKPEALKDIVVGTINKVLDSRLRDKSGVIDVMKVGDIVYLKLDPGTRAPVPVRFTSVQHIRQMVRGVVRGRADIFALLNVPEDDSQQSLYDKPILQPFYPVDSNKYLRREYMKTEQRRKVAAWLRKSGKSRIAHANMLDAETDKLIAEGKLDPDKAEKEKQDVLSEQRPVAL